MKRKLTITLLGILFLFYVSAQDGSDIIYYNPENLNNTFIGKLCHIDFGKISFRGQSIDTIEIPINGKRMRFYEHREDNGFYNWFNKQYLIRIKDDTNILTRLQDSRIDSITSDRVYVTSILSYYVNESPIDSITIFQHWYSRKNIVKVLIKN